MKFAIVLAFETPDVTPHLAEISKAAGHIPKFWAVSETDRALVQRMFAAPRAAFTQVVKYGIEIPVTPENLQHYIELFDEVARKSAQKTFLLTEAKIFCVEAFGGTWESVTQQIRSSQTEHDPEKLEERPNANC